VNSGVRRLEASHSSDGFCKILQRWHTDHAWPWYYVLKALGSVEEERLAGGTVTLNMDFQRPFYHPSPTKVLPFIHKVWREPCTIEYETELFCRLYVVSV